MSFPVGRLGISHSHRKLSKFIWLRLAGVKSRSENKVTESSHLPNTTVFTPKPTSHIHLLNTSRDGNSTPILGSLFQCLPTLSMRTFILISNLNLPCYSLRPFPLVLSWSAENFTSIGNGRKKPKNISIIILKYLFKLIGRIIQKNPLLHQQKSITKTIYWSCPQSSQLLWTSFQPDLCSTTASKDSLTPRVSSCSC